MSTVKNVTLTQKENASITRAINKATNSKAKANANANKEAQNKLKSKQAPKPLAKSKGHLKIEKRINDLKSIQGKRDLTMQEIGWKVNATNKLEDRTLSQLYKWMTKVMPLADRVELVGSKKIPTFNEFSAVAPRKLLFGKYDVIRMLQKFNKKAIAKAKAERQNKATTKK